MWKCPVCSGSDKTEHICAQCGFDERMDFVGNRTISPVSATNMRIWKDCEMRSRAYMAYREAEQHKREAAESEQRRQEAAEEERRKREAEKALQQETESGNTAYKVQKQHKAHLLILLGLLFVGVLSSLSFCGRGISNKKTSDRADINVGETDTVYSTDNMTETEAANDTNDSNHTDNSESLGNMANVPNLEFINAGENGQYIKHPIETTEDGAYILREVSNSAAPIELTLEGWSVDAASDCSELQAEALDDAAEGYTDARRDIRIQLYNQNYTDDRFIEQKQSTHEQYKADARLLNEQLVGKQEIEIDGMTVSYMTLFYQWDSNQANRNVTSWVCLENGSYLKTEINTWINGIAAVGTNDTEDDLSYFFKDSEEEVVRDFYENMKVTLLQEEDISQQSLPTLNEEGDLVISEGTGGTVTPVAVMFAKPYTVGYAHTDEIDLAFHYEAEDAGMLYVAAEMHLYSKETYTSDNFASDTNSDYRWTDYISSQRVTDNEPVVWGTINDFEVHWVMQRSEFPDGHQLVEYYAWAEDGAGDLLAVNGYVTGNVKDAGDDTIASLIAGIYQLVRE